MTEVEKRATRLANQIKDLLIGKRCDVIVCALANSLMCVAVEIENCDRTPPSPSEIKNAAKQLSKLFAGERVYGCGLDLFETINNEGGRVHH
jgi:hypothetical protein